MGCYVSKPLAQKAQWRDTKSALHPERLKCQVSHFHGETRLFRASACPKVIPVRSVVSKAQLTRRSMWSITNSSKSWFTWPRITCGMSIYDPPVERGCAAVRIEEIDAKAGYGKRRRLAAPWGTSNDEHY
jgi:hypothetical protein